MPEKSKYLDKTEACYEVEYDLRKDLHYRKGEILKLEYINAKHCREIERLQDSIGDLNVTHHNDVETLANRIEGLEFELNIRNVPAMKESLKSSARLAMKQEEEIERLNNRISTILETTPDVPETVRGDQIDYITECKDLFEYIKSVIVVLSEKEGNRPEDPSVIDMKYIKSAVRYTMPGLFNIYALIGDEDIHKIELADSILHKFGIETMAKYEELIQRGDIGIDILDHRRPHPPKGL